MKITSVRYAQLFNTGDYQNQKFEIEALLENDDTVESTLENLQSIVLAQKRFSDARTEFLELSDRFKHRLAHCPNDPIPNYYRQELDSLKRKLETDFPNRFNFSDLENNSFVPQIEAAVFS
jgi:hypothetical protein